MAGHDAPRHASRHATSSLIAVPVAAIQTASICWGDVMREETIMIADRFDSRTLANMEVALEGACEMLSIGA